MLLRFLRLFQAFCDLEADRDATVLDLREELQRESARNSQLEDRLNSAIEERDRIWLRLDNATVEARKAYQMNVNRAWQEAGQDAPYPDAPHFRKPDPSDIPEPVRRPMLASEAVALATQAWARRKVVKSR